MSKTNSTPPSAAIDYLKTLGEEMKKLNIRLEKAALPASKATSTLSGKSVAGVSGQELNKGFSVEGNTVIAPDGSRMPLTKSKAIGWGEYLKDLHRACSAPLSDESQKLMEKHGSVFAKDLSAQGGSTGGYTIPPQFVATLLSVAAEYAHIRPLATIMPMASKTLQVPALDLTFGQNGRSPFLGGVQAAWTEEVAEKAESEPAFKQVDMEAHELTLICNTSNVLVQDSALTLDAVLTSLFGMAIAWYEDFAFLRGDGVGKPQGMLGSPCAVGVNRGTATTFRLVDVANMWSRLLAPSMSRAVWIVSQSVIPQLIQLQGANGDVVFIPNYGGAAPGQGGITMAMPGTLLGRPVIVTEKLPPLGTPGDVMLVDPTMYLIGDRMEMALEASPHARFTRNQTVWRAIKRVDGQPWMTAPATLADGVTTVSPFIFLN